MRPRHFASENDHFLSTSKLTTSGFNEAEAFCLGKRSAGHPPPRLGPGFNEAEAFCLGKPEAEAEAYLAQDLLQ